MSFVTFITPTKCRNSIDKTISSLLQQSDPDWRLFIVQDGCSKFETHNDPRIKVITSESRIGHAGVVRNIALEQEDLYSSKWIAFVDDDDWLDLGYVKVIKDVSMSRPEVDIFQFTYRDVETGNVQPPKGLGNKPLLGHMGISFVIKTTFVKEHSIRFRVIGCEDYHFLADCVNAGAKYHNTDLMIYYVGHRSAWS